MMTTNRPPYSPRRRDFLRRFGKAALYASLAFIGVAWQNQFR